MRFPVLIHLATPLLRKKMHETLIVHGGDPSKDCTQREYATSEWSEYEGRDPQTHDWESYKKARPWNLLSHATKAPKAGDAVVDGKVVLMDGTESTLLRVIQDLGAGHTYVSLNFASLTCPVWRLFAGADLHRAMAAHGVKPLHIYTLEAHPDDVRPANRKDGGGAGEHAGGDFPPPFQLKEPGNFHASIDDRKAAAEKALSLLRLKIAGPVTMVLDSMDDALEAAYETRPWRVYVVEVATGAIAYASGPGPLNLPGKLADLDAFFAAAK